MLPNWFVALPVLPRIVTNLPRVPPGFRAFHPEDVHMTLMFLGACGEQPARRALEALAQTWREQPVPPLVVSLGEVVPMGPPRRYSALSAVVLQGNASAVQFLSQWRDVAADAAGINRDQRSPLPHVTIARPQRKATDEQRAAGLEWAASLTLPQELVRLDQVALYTWSESRLPRLFQIVATTPLTGLE